MDELTKQAFNYVMTKAYKSLDPDDDAVSTPITRWTGLLVVSAEILPTNPCEALCISPYRAAYVKPEDYDVDDGIPAEFMFEMEIPKTGTPQYPLLMHIKDGKPQSIIFEAEDGQPTVCSPEDVAVRVVNDVSVRVGVISDSYPNALITRAKVADMISKFYNLETPIPEGLITLINMEDHPPLIDIVATVTPSSVILADVNPVKYAEDEFIVSAIGSYDEWPPLYTTEPI